MNTDPRALVKQWRAEAETLNRRGADASASALSSCADDLERCLDEQELEPLTLAEASELSGYSRDHLGRLIAEGTIPNAGERYAPRIRRRDLPRKPGHAAGPAPEAEEALTSRVQMARSVVESE